VFEWQLTRRLRTAITLAALALLMLVGVTWGWAQVLKPFPGKVDVPICVDTSYRAGDELFVQDVTVSVFNASKREGLAARTMQELEDAGFAAGQTANAPKGTSLTAPAEIWVHDTDNPAAKLLRARVGRVPVVEHPENRAAGITLVVGDQFGDLRKGPDSVILSDDAVVCSPPVE
jgi:LytR cell envelope-related transcriptional attenuator